MGLLVGPGRCASDYLGNGGLRGSWPDADEDSVDGREHGEMPEVRA